MARKSMSGGAETIVIDVQGQLRGADDDLEKAKDRTKTESERLRLIAEAQVKVNRAEARIREARNYGRE